MAKTMTWLIGAVALVAAVAAASASDSDTDYSALRSDARVQGELLGASEAYLIDEQCPTIRLRRLKLVGRALSLNSHAKSLGYTGKEVETYVNDPDEQARFRKLAMEYLATLGAVEGDPESFCVAGRALMEKGTYAGSLLKGR